MIPKLVSHPSLRILLTELTVAGLTRIGDDVVKETVPQEKTATLIPGAMLHVDAVTITVPHIVTFSGAAVMGEEVVPLTLNLPQADFNRITSPLLVGGDPNAPHQGPRLLTNG